MKKGRQLSRNYSNEEPRHPGAAIKETIFRYGVSKQYVADQLGISRQMLHDIISEKKSLTPRVAVAAGHFFGGGTLHWVSMQAAHDVWHAEREIDVSGIVPLTE